MSYRTCNQCVRPNKPNFMRMLADAAQVYVDLKWWQFRKRRTHRRLMGLLSAQWTVAGVMDGTDEEPTFEERFNEHMMYRKDAALTVIHEQHSIYDWFSQLDDLGGPA